MPEQDAKRGKFNWPGPTPDYVEQIRTEARFEQKGKTPNRRSILLDQKANLLQARDSYTAKWRIIHYAGILAFITFSIMALALWLKSVHNDFAITGLIIFGVYGAVIFFIPRNQSIDALLSQVEDDLDAIDHSERDIDQRAERQLNHHQEQLKQYYAQTLAQSRGVFSLGVVCVCAGFVIVLVTLWFLAQEPKTGSAIPQNKIVIATIGALGTILTDFVGAIYLKMHAGSVRSLTEFHNRLVGTHHLHLAYFIASKIDDTAKTPNLMDKTFASMALHVSATPIEHLHDSPKEDSSAGSGTKIPNGKKPAKTPV